MVGLVGDMVRRGVVGCRYEEFRVFCIGKVGTMRGFGETRWSGIRLLLRCCAADNQRTSPL